MKHNISLEILSKNISKNSLRVPVHIYGSGISGLITAYNFLKIGFLDVNIHTRGRGIIQSELTEHGVVEYAANSILQNQAVTDLLTELEIEYEYYSSLGKKKYIYTNRQAKRWPLSFFESLLALPAILKLGFKTKKAKPKEYETIADWAERSVGRNFSEKLIEIGLQGIYGPNTKDLSAKLCLSSLFEKKTGGTSKGSISFKNGMGSFIKVLENEVSMLGAKFNTVSESEKQEQKDGISIISSPAYSVPSFVKNDFSNVKYHKISTATYILNETERLSFKGFGCLFNLKTSNGVLGVILNSDLFDNRALEGKVSETWILDGEIYKSENDLENLRLFRSEFFNVTTEPEERYFKYWEKAFPVYNLDLEKTLDNMIKERNIYFFANWTGKIGIGRLIEESPRFIAGVIQDMSSKKT